jgi:23S rRNA (cytosine1962-C5)-methyltransferase
MLADPRSGYSTDRNRAANNRPRRSVDFPTRAITIAGMSTETSSQTPAVVRRLFPVLWSDDHYVAVGKPPRVNLESAAWRHGPRVIDVVAEAAGAPPAARQPEDAALLPLILPERLSSGLALFARGEEARRRFAGMAATNKLRFLHTAVVRGAPPRPKIALKPNRVASSPGKGKGKKKTAGRPPAKLPAPAKIEILDSAGDLHVASCATTASALEDVRKLFKAAGGLELVGDIRPSPYAAQRRTNPTRRPLLHLARLSFPHPFRPGTIEITDRTPRAFGAYLATQVLLEEHLRAALAARLGLLCDRDTSAYRLFTGRNEGISGMVADRLGSCVVLEELGGHFKHDRELLRHAGGWYRRMLGVKHVYLRHTPAPQRGNRRGSVGASGSRITRLHGDGVEETTIKEHGVKFIVQPGSSQAPGLFLDQRENRKRIARLAAGKDVLNLFAYTCGFSVAAAAAGARSTTSVDLAVNHLEWGKRNFAANGIALAAHRFIRSDALEYFKRAQRQQHAFDIVVLDPPTFARVKKPRRTFEIKRDLGRLIVESAALLRPGGRLFISTNCRQLHLSWLIGQVEESLDPDGFEVVAKPKLPVDFAADADYQRAILVRVY